MGWRKIAIALVLQALLAGAAWADEPSSGDDALPASGFSIQGDSGLTQDEADRLYDAQGHLHRRLTLLVAFVDARLSKMHDLCAEAPSATDAQKIRSLLEQIGSLIARADDDLDQDQGQVFDSTKLPGMRAGLKEVIAAFGRYGHALEPVDAAAASVAWKSYAPVFQGTLQSVEDTLKSSLGVAQAYLQNDQQVD